MAVFWVNADSKEKLRLGFSDIARELGIGGRSEESFDPISASEAAKGWLAKPVQVLDQAQDVVTLLEARWLLILDNADDPKILEDYWPCLEAGSVLITSRRSKDAFIRDTGARKMEVKELEPLLVEEGAELVQSWTRCRGEHQLGRSLKISHLLGGIPLALLQCAHLISAEDLTFSDFLAWHNKAEDRELLIRKMESASVENGELSIPARGTIGITWAMNQLSPQARSIVDTLIFFDPDKIDEEILLKAKRLNAGLLLEDFPRRPSAYLKARSELTSRADLKLNPSEKQQQLKIHRSVQHIFNFYISAKRRVKAFNCAVALLWNYYESDWEAGRSHNIKRWAKFNLLYDHLKRMIEVWDTYELDQIGESNLQFADLLNQCSWY